MFLKTQKSIIRIVTLTGVLAAYSTGAWSYGGQFEGIVTGIIDGDTITVLDRQKKSHKIRLAFIDAPEKGQPFGKASKKHLSDLIFQQEVKVKVIPGSTYGREIGIIYVRQHDKEINANLRQIQSGYAWLYRHYARKQLSRHEYLTWGEAETLARSAHIGLWADPNPVAPWIYRKHAKWLKNGGEMEKLAEKLAREIITDAQKKAKEYANENLH